MTSPRVQRHRRAEANRRRVTTRGKRVPRPRTPKPPARRAKYRKSAVLGGLSGMFGALFLATGQILWAVGAVTQAAGAAAAAYVDYRRDLIEVKRTGRPVVDHPSPGRTGPAPVRSSTQNKPRTKQASDHMARCKAKPPGGPTCRCPDGPNRKSAPKTGTKRTTTRKRTK